MNGGFFAGFDDWMEEQEPGYKATKADRKAQRVHASQQRRAALLKRYGSEALAFAPCEREARLREAVRPWRVPQATPHQRWTQSIDGCSSFLHKLSDRVRAAIASAYPLPTTFREALAEHRYWQARQQELEDLLGPDFGDDGLDLVARLRADMVADLARKDLPVTTLADLRDRFAMYRADEDHNVEIEKALFRDLDAMVRAGQRLEPAEPAP